MVSARNLPKSFKARLAVYSLAAHSLKPSETHYIFLLSPSFSISKEGLTELAEVPISETMREYLKTRDAILLSGRRFNVAVPGDGPRRLRGELDALASLAELLV